jgi:uncharacterized protein
LKLYLDTSVVVALFVAENIMHSTVAQQAVSSATVLASSEITYAETRAAFAQLKHTKRISKNEYKRAVSDFETAWLDFERIDIDESLARLGGVLADTLLLKGYDSIQLAAAVTMHVVSRDVEFLTFDQRLEKKAQTLGRVPIWSP